MYLNVFCQIVMYFNIYISIETSFSYLLYYQKYFLCFWIAFIILWWYSVFSKNSCFHNSLPPLPRLHGSKRPPKLSTQCQCTVTPIDWERRQTFEIFLEKNTILNTLYVILLCMSVCLARPATV